MKIGLISDTHGYFDPRIPELFEGVERILHAGDIGSYSILNSLEEIAPVTAVLGNTDGVMNVRESEVLRWNGNVFLLRHIVDVHSIEGELQDQLTRVDPRFVIFGHTHKPLCEEIQGRWFLNPGYAGRQRFDLPRSVAILECGEKTSSTRFIAL